MISRRLLIYCLFLLLIVSPAYANSDAVPVFAIQGETHQSPYVGTRVTTQGIVTYSDGKRLVWIQAAQGDGNEKTSDAIRLQSGRLAKLSTVGDLVKVEGRVKEAGGRRALKVTELFEIQNLHILSHNNPLPAQVSLDKLPDIDHRLARDVWESLEGMRVVVHGPIVVGPENAKNEFVVISAKASVLSSGYDSNSGYLRVRPLGKGVVDYNPERIFVRPVGQGISTKMELADRAEKLEGIVDYSHGRYWLLQTKKTNWVKEKIPREIDIAKSAGYRVVTLNVENLIGKRQHPRIQDKLNQLAALFSDRLQQPDLITLQEVGSKDLLNELIKKINRVSETKYAGKLIPSSDSRTISSAFLWRIDTVKLKRAWLLNDGDGLDYPGREPLVGLFLISGRDVVAINVHLLSKLRDESLYGKRFPPGRKSEKKRHRQAEVIRLFVTSMFRQGYKNIIVSGDFNDFEFAEPGESPHTLEIIAGTDPDTQLINAGLSLDIHKRVSYIYDGNAQALDHILMSNTISSGIKQIIYPSLNTRTGQGRDGMRSSDHNPVVVDLAWQ